MAQNMDAGSRCSSRQALLGSGDGSRFDVCDYGMQAMLDSLLRQGQADTRCAAGDYRYATGEGG